LLISYYMDEVYYNDKGNEVMLIKYAKNQNAGDGARNVDNGVTSSR